MKNWVKASIITGSALLVAGITYYILKKKGIILKAVVDYDKKCNEIMAAIKSMSNTDKAAKLRAVLSDAEVGQAQILTNQYETDKTKLTPTEMENLYRYLVRAFGNVVNAEGTGKGARSWHIPVYYPRKTT